MIAILNFKQWKNDDDYLRTYSITDNQKGHQIDTIKWYYIELPKFRPEASLANLSEHKIHLTYWLDFLQNAQRKVEIPINVPGPIIHAYALSRITDWTQEDINKLNKQLGIVNPYEKALKDLEDTKREREGENRKHEEEKKQMEEEFKQAFNILEKRNRGGGLSGDGIALIKKFKIQ